jgi:hypothetical protein
MSLNMSRVLIKWRKMKMLNKIMLTSKEDN